MPVPVGIAAAELWLPPGRDTAEQAVREGRIRARQAADADHPEVPDAADEAPPDMAVRAARAALARTGLKPEHLDMVCHASMYYQGHDLWSPAHYIAERLGAFRAFPVGVQQICNGGCAAIELTVARLAMGQAGWGMVTTADRFAGPGFDRWASDYGVVYGDAATALLLRVPGAEDDGLLLRSVVTVAAPELEGMHRGADPFAPAARTRRTRVDMRATKQAYLRVNGKEPFVTANRRSIQTIVTTALRESGLSADDSRLRCAVLPRFGRKTLDDAWLPALDGCVRTELVDLGRTTGHLGAGDAAASVAELERRRLLAAGEFALVFSAGAGFTWSCLAIQAR